jgi:hypothetical protein
VITLSGETVAPEMSLLTLKAFGNKAFTYYMCLKLAFPELVLKGFGQLLLFVMSS